ncbi:MAG: aldo/keto reductase [Elusimicrobia bacterium]|nr:aldo/keto reductase [Elusimicrobiota bacterium]
MKAPIARGADPGLGSLVRRRALGTTGLNPSEIGFGAWGIGADSKGAVSYGPVDDGESLSALRQAVDIGVNFFDTADLYGYGHSETLIGTALKPLRRSILLASKAGSLDAGGRQDFSPRHLRKALDGSLRRLRTDYLDLYQLHSPPLDLLRKDPRIVDAMRRFQREGKIRAWGISVRSPDEGLDAVRDLEAQTIQVNFNMADQRARTTGLLARCRQAGVGVIVRTPLCFGFLTGKYTPDSEFHSLDHRSSWRREQLALWSRAPQIFSAAIKPVRGQTPAQLALRYCLSYPEVSTVIPGILTRRHLAENAAASRLGPLRKMDRVAIERVYERNVFFLGIKPSRKSRSTRRTRP